MNTAIAPSADEHQLDAAANRKRRGRWFFTGLAIATCATIVLGFARSYYFRSLLPTPPLPTIFHVHGALFTAWVVLFAAQSFLISKSKVSVHRRLGVAGALLVVPM